LFDICNAIPFVGEILFFILFLFEFESCFFIFEFLHLFYFIFHLSLYFILHLSFYFNLILFAWNGGRRGLMSGMGGECVRA
jgi:hypothetical protein